MTTGRVLPSKRAPLGVGVTGGNVLEEVGVAADAGWWKDLQWQ